MVAFCKSCICSKKVDLIVAGPGVGLLEQRGLLIPRRHIGLDEYMTLGVKSCGNGLICFGSYVGDDNLPVGFGKEVLDKAEAYSRAAA